MEPRSYAGLKAYDQKVAPASAPSTVVKEGILNVK